MKAETRVCHLWSRSQNNVVAFERQPRFLADHRVNHFITEKIPDNI